MAEQLTQKRDANLWDEVKKIRGAKSQTPITPLAVNLARTKSVIYLLANMSSIQLRVT